MCGIAGSIDPSGQAAKFLTAQLATLEHRGPDAVGEFVDAEAALGQTRLAVVDLVTGDPPVTNEDGTIGVALNGEIYNFHELRRSLAKSGHQLRTSGDTEVLAHLAETSEPAEIAKSVDGMFAFAIWDRRRHRLVLARDRVGKKPLFYWTDGYRFVFASEPKALFAHPRVPVRLATEQLPTYLTFGYVPAPWTIYEGIFSVPPAHVLVVQSGMRPSLECYWHIPVCSNRDSSLSSPSGEYGSLVRQALERAVERRLTADVPLGAFLSGGVDSSAIVATMANLDAHPIRTFTIGFDDRDGFDERPYANLVAKRFRTEHTEFVVKPNLVELIETLVWHHDQPFGDSSALPTYMLSELTRKTVTVALCGDGGDELFAGYQRFAFALLLSRIQSLPKELQAGVNSLCSAVTSRLPMRMSTIRQANTFFEACSEPLHRALLGWTTKLPSGWREALTGGSYVPGLVQYDSIWEQTADYDLLDRLLVLNFQTYLPEDLLPKVDRMSMAHALEVRSPFLDTELIECAMRLPGSSKIRALSLKRILKRAMRGVLPPQVLYRPKHGFGVPLDRWFREDARQFLESTLTSSHASIRQHLRNQPLDQLVKLHTSGEGNYGHVLWTLCTLEVFLRKHGW